MCSIFAWILGKVSIISTVSHSSDHPCLTENQGQAKSLQKTGWGTCDAVCVYIV